MKKILVILLPFGLCALAFGQSGVNVGLLESTPDHLVITPATATTIAGSSVQFQAQLINADGSSGGLMTGQCFTGWSSGNTPVATISNTGLATGVSAGSASITCALPTNLAITGSAILTVNGPPLITNPAICGTPPCPLANGFQNVAGYSFLLGASGGTAPYTWTISAGSLPTGLSLSSTGCGSNVNCNIQGTPTVLGTTVFTVKATDSGANANTLQVSITIVAAAGVVTLSQTWVNNNEGNTVTNEFTLTSGSFSAGSIPSGCTFHLPYADSCAGIQSAVNDMEACRTLKSGAAQITLDIPATLHTTASANCVTIPQTNTVAASTFLIIRSVSDASLPNRTTVCSHGIQDNLSASTDPGIENSTCNGTGMSYQLGTTVTTIAPGAFTLANGTNTNTSSYNDVQYMYTLETSNTSGIALQTCSSVTSPACGASTIGPDHWLIEDGEIRPQAGVKVANYIAAMSPSQVETSTAQLSSHIHLRKMWLHGDWANTIAGLAAGANNVSAGINWWCIYCSIVDSAFTEIIRPGAESHVITAQGQQLKVDHNWLEGASSPLFSGGFGNSPGSLVTTYGYVPYIDVEVRRNRLTYPYAWLGQSPVGAGVNANYPASFSLVRKNALENKEGARIVYWGNILENTDNAGAQSGPLFLAQPLNNSSGTLSQNYQTTYHDLAFGYNVARNSCDAVILQRSDDTNGGVGYVMHHTWFYQNLFYNVSHSNPGCSSATNQALSPSSGGQQWQGTITGTGVTARFVANCSVDAGGCPGQIGSLAVGTGGTGCVAGNLVFSGGTQTLGGLPPSGTYTCSGGALATVTLKKPGSQYHGIPAATLTTGTGTVTVTMVSTPVQPPAGYEVMDIQTGDPVAPMFCTAVPAFNVPTTTFSLTWVWPSGVTTKASTGSAAWSGSFNSAGVTVAYPSAVSGTDSAGYCTVSNTLGGPQNFLWQHNTLITDATYTITASNTHNNVGPNYGINALYRDSLLLGNGWNNSDRGEGTPSETFNYDITSLTNDHTVFVGRLASKYTEYGNNAAFPDTSGCTGAGCNPPINMFFPGTGYCTGATATSNCVGFTGAMSQSSMPLTISDWHNWKLVASSIFKAGGSSQASDGTDMGASVTSAIDTAETQTTFVCPSTCGSPGPYSD